MKCAICGREGARLVEIRYKSGDKDTTAVCEGCEQKDERGMSRVGLHILLVEMGNDFKTGEMPESDRDAIMRQLVQSRLSVSNKQCQRNLRNGVIRFVLMTYLQAIIVAASFGLGYLIYKVVVKLLQ